MNRQVLSIAVRLCSSIPGLLRVFLKLEIEVNLIKWLLNVYGNGQNFPLLLSD